VKIDISPLNNFVHRFISYDDDDDDTNEATEQTFCANGEMPISMRI
jgi:hypothetical protein